MRRQLNTLYVTTEGAWLKKDGANVVMEVEGDERAPAHSYAGERGVLRARNDIAAITWFLR